MHGGAGLGDDRVCGGAPQLIGLLSLKTAKVHAVRQVVGSHPQVALLAAGGIAVGTGALGARRNHRGGLGVTGRGQRTQLGQESVWPGRNFGGRAVRVCALHTWAALSLGRGCPTRPQGEADAPGNSALSSSPCSATDGRSLVLLSTEVGVIVERLVAAAGAGQLRQLSERVDGGGGGLAAVRPDGAALLDGADLVSAGQRAGAIVFGPERLLCRVLRVVAVVLRSMVLVVTELVLRQLLMSVEGVGERQGLHGVVDDGGPGHLPRRLPGVAAAGLHWAAALTVAE